MSFRETSRSQMLHVSCSDLLVPKRLPALLVSSQAELRLYFNHLGRDFAGFFQPPQPREARDQNSMISGVEPVFVGGHLAPPYRVLLFTLSVGRDIERHIVIEKTLIEGRKP